jgi:hypothetical protein
MPRTWKLPDIGTDVPQWAQGILTAIKRMLSPPTFPPRNRMLVQSGQYGWINWVEIGSTLTLTGITASNIGTIDIDDSVLGEIATGGGGSLAFSQIEGGNASSIYGLDQFLDGGPA